MRLLLSFLRNDVYHSSYVYICLCILTCMCVTSTDDLFLQNMKSGLDKYFWKRNLWNVISPVMYGNTQYALCPQWSRVKKNNLSEGRATGDSVAHGLTTGLWCTSCILKGSNSFTPITYVCRQLQFLLDGAIPSSLQYTSRTLNDNSKMWKSCLVMYFYSIRHTTNSCMFVYFSFTVHKLL